MSGVFPFKTPKNLDYKTELGIWDCLESKKTTSYSKLIHDLDTRGHSKEVVGDWEASLRRRRKGACLILQFN